MFWDPCPALPPLNHLTSPVWCPKVWVNNLGECLSACVHSSRFTVIASCRAYWHVWMCMCLLVPQNPGPLKANVSHHGDKMWCVTWHTHRLKGQTLAVHLANVHMHTHTYRLANGWRWVISSAKQLERKRGCGSLFLCATHWYQYTTLNWISPVGWLKGILLHMAM